MSLNPGISMTNFHTSTHLLTTATNKNMFHIKNWRA